MLEEVEHSLALDAVRVPKGAVQWESLGSWALHAGLVEPTHNWLPEKLKCLLESWQARAGGANGRSKNTSPWESRVRGIIVSTSHFQWSHEVFYL